ncbi:hypothetical protein [Spongiimicrobium sp. 3-5]|uniref:M61 family metallopeptidase n=1 Tax=Spongiimicrobium sp. 3-5 TaxID=3332596 RepID=UPI00397F7D39
MTEVKNDQISVNLNVEGLATDTIQFCFPKIVPGIYGAMNYGNSVEEIIFKNDRGDILLNKKLGENCWELYEAKSLSEITYKVNDNWEEFDATLKGFYHSASSSFKEDVFVINGNTLFGYFRNYQAFPIQVKVKKTQKMSAATSLPIKEATHFNDVFYAKSYNQLVDNPILYSIPDTTSIKLPNINVKVACYSTTATPIANEIAEHIKPLLTNQSKYLGDKLPVSQYTFIIYHSLAKDYESFFADGLEHSNSTLILLNSPLDIETIKNTVYGIASHEFFHILMPLGIHSYEIADYDFNEPKFSKHLWLYEGMTEYFTIHMPIKNGLQSFNEFTKVIEGKHSKMQKFNNKLAITDLSINSMDMQDQYYNVYLKGALINLCLDIELREFSNGTFGTQELVLELLNKYGPNKAFEDDKLFEEIEKITGHSQLNGFFKKYVAGNAQLPLKEYLFKVGLALNGDSIKEVENLSVEQKKLRKYWIGQ